MLAFFGHAWWWISISIYATVNEHVISDHLVGGREATTQQVSDNIDDTFVQFREPQHFLLALGPAVLNDPLHFLMDKLHTAQTGLLQPTDLSLD